MKLTLEQEQRERDAALMSRDEVADKLFPIHEQFLERKNFREGFTRGYLARAEIAAADREQRQSEQVAWLIEFGTTPTYWQGWHAQAGMSPNAALFWTSNPHEAVRFSRHEDASRVIAILGLSGAPVEHMFIDAILAPREKGGV